MCRSKGSDDYNRETLARDLAAGGYKRQILRSDGEPAILAHGRATMDAAMLKDEQLDFVPETVSKGQSPGNGLAEGAVKESGYAFLYKN